ncbi:MAG: CPBP family intramembrane glutamic endopeptidase [Nanoarchaeota archaeon]
MALISQLLTTDLIWFGVGIIFLLGYFWLRKMIPHHAIFSLNYQSIMKTFIIPTITIFVVLSIFRFAAGILLIEAGAKNIFSLLSYIIIGPFFEELFIRGLILGGAFFLSSRIDNKKASWAFIILGFIIQLFVFVWIHGYTDTIRIIYLTIIGITYSLLFIINKRDVLPAMIAHAIGNAMIILGVFA